MHIKNYRLPKLSIIFLSILPLSYLVAPSRYLAVLHINIVFILAAILFIVIELIITKTPINKNGITPIILLCLVVSLFAIIKSSTKDDFSEALSFIMIFVLFFFVSINKYDENDIRFLLNALVFFGVTIAVFMILRGQGYIDVFGNLHKDRKSFKNFTNTLFDPNFLSSTMIIPVVICFYKIFYAKKLLSKLVYVGAMGLILFGILRTGSRSAFVGLVAGLFFAFIHILLNRFNKSKTHVFIISLLILALILALIIFFISLPDYIINRYFKTSYMDQSNIDRFKFWINSFNIIKEKPFFGYGFQHYININFEFTGLDRDVHNTYLTLIFFFGIIGVLPFVLFFLYFLIKNFKKDNIFIFGIIAAFMLMALIISSHRSLYFLTTFYFLIILLNFLENNKNIKLDYILNNNP